MRTLIVSLLLLSACAHHTGKKQTTVDTPVATNKTDGSHYVTIEFAKGKTSLTESSKKNLQELASIARKTTRKVADIKVLAWSDHEYPSKATIAPNNEVILASERARSIKNYLEDDLKTKADIDFYNMAKRPNIISRVFETDEYEVKDTFERVGTANARTKASKAMVIIDYDYTEKK
jgi:hypothetical protein